MTCQNECGRALVFDQLNSDELKEWEPESSLLGNREPDAPTTIVLLLIIKLVEY